MSSRTNMSTVVEPKKAPVRKSLRLNDYPWYSPRFWHGMRLGDFLKMLARGRFRINPLRIVMALIIAFCAVGNSICALLQRLIYGRRIAATEIKQPPIFIIGHWRSGTTYLHELMVCDERLGVSHLLRMLRAEPCSGDRLDCADTAEVVAAAQAADGQHGNWLASATGRRICIGGDGGADAVLPHGVSERAAAVQRVFRHGRLRAGRSDRWRRDMQRFVQMLTLQKQGKRLMMKSPPHTGPDRRTGQTVSRGEIHSHRARSVHDFSQHAAVVGVARRRQGLQHPHHRDLDEYVLSAFERMYRGFNRQRARFRPINLRVEIRRPGARSDGSIAPHLRATRIGRFRFGLQPDSKRTSASQKDYKTNATSWSRNCAPKSAAAGAIISSGMGMSEIR